MWETGAGAVNGKPSENGRLIELLSLLRSECFPFRCGKQRFKQKTNAADSKSPGDLICLFAEITLCTMSQNIYACRQCNRKWKLKRISAVPKGCFSKKSVIFDAVLTVSAVSQDRNFCHFASCSGGGSHEKDRYGLFLPLPAVKPILIQLRVGSKHSSSFCRIHGRSASNPYDKIRVVIPGGFACPYTGFNRGILVDIVKNEEFDISLLQQFLYIIQCTAFFCGMLSGHKEATLAKRVK